MRGRKSEHALPFVLLLLGKLAWGTALRLRQEACLTHAVHLPTRSEPCRPTVPATFDLQYPCRCRLAAACGVHAQKRTKARRVCSSVEQSHNVTHQGYHSTVLHGLGAVLRVLVGLLVGFLVVVFATSAHAREDALTCDPATRPTWPVLQRVSPHLWRVAAQRGEPDSVNRGETTQLVIAVEASGVWLIGSGPSPAYGARLACAVKRAIGRAVTDVVNTRAAPELAMGNVAFPQAMLWALPDVIVSMRARCVTCLERLKSRIGAAGESLQEELIRAPDVPVEARRLGPFSWRSLPRMKGENVLVLRHRADRIVVAQGLLWEGDVPDLHEAHIDVIASSLRALQGFAQGARLLGEQGELTGPSAIAQHLRYVKQLRAAVWAQLQRGEAQGASGVSAELPEFASLPSYAARHPLHAQRVWRELEPAMFR
jgi:hypothetical protein